MPWYAWVFDGVGGAAVLSAASWLLSRMKRKPPAAAAPMVPQAPPAQAHPAQVPQQAPPTQATPTAPSATALLVTATPGVKPLIELLLAVPGMNDPDFRRSAYEKVPQPVVEQIRMNSAARIELLNMIDAFDDYPHLAPWRALLDALLVRLPAHPAVGELASGLAARGLLNAP
jgi:hypothetical protein